MKRAALKAMRSPDTGRLRISIEAEDAEAAAEVRRLLEEAGHEVVEANQAGFDAVRETERRALLTPREADVLEAIGEGLSNKEIARRFDISLHTVKFHVESIFRRLGARTRTQALAKAAERQMDV